MFVNKMCSKFFFVMAMAIALSWSVPMQGLVSPALADTPEVVSATKNDGEVFINFSKPMNPLTVNRDTVNIQVRLPGVGHGTLAGTVDYEGTTAIFSSYSDFLPGLEYTLLINTGAEDTEGNPLQSYYTWFFKLAEQTWNFAVMSDLHYYDTDLGISGAAFEEYLASDRKLLRESEEILKAAIESVKSNSETDFVIIPGDMTKDGELSSHQELAAYLKTLEDSGIQVYVVPGNHDINNPHALSFNGDETTPVDTVTPEEFAQIYSDYGYGEAIYRDTDSLSYVAEPASGLWLFGLDSCEYDENEALGKPVTSGRLSQETIDWVLEKLGQAKEQNKEVIGIMHHGLLEHFTGQSQFNPGSEYVIEDWENISETLAKAGLNLIFTGHYHAQDAVSKTWETASLFDVQTGSLSTYPNPYRVVTYSQQDNKVNIISEFITEIDYDTGSLSFQEYSEADLDEGLSGLIYYMLTLPPEQGGFGVPAEQAGMLVPYASAAFKAHYAGDETPTQETLVMINTLIESQDPTSKMLGQILLSLWTDRPPADNMLTIQLPD
ncbi:MAG: metallophosphoesterase [Desulfobacterales bacterium]|nr:metallophosphoesterase [Desulfobacterales bacterium]